MSKETDSMINKIQKVLADHQSGINKYIAFIEEAQKQVAEAQAKMDACADAEDLTGYSKEKEARIKAENNIEVYSRKLQEAKEKELISESASNREVEKVLKAQGAAVDTFKSEVKTALDLLFSARKKFLESVNECSDAAKDWERTIRPYTGDMFDYGYPASDSTYHRASLGSAEQDFIWGYNALQEVLDLISHREALKGITDFDAADYEPEKVYTPWCERPVEVGTAQRVVGVFKDALDAPKKPKYNTNKKIVIYPMQ